MPLVYREYGNTCQGQGLGLNTYIYGYSILALPARHSRLYVNRLCLTVKHERNTKMDNLTKWTEAAERALPVAVNAKASKEQKQTAFSELAFLSLQVLASGKAKDEISLAKAVSKEGKFQALRQCVSNARPLANMLHEGKDIVIENKKEKTFSTFSKAQILETETALFSVASAYKAYRATQEKVVKEMTNDDFAKLELEATGEMTFSEFSKLSQGAKDDVINRGKIRYTEGLKEQATMQAAANLQMVIDAYNDLSDDDKETFLKSIGEASQAQAA